METDIIEISGIKYRLNTYYINETIEIYEEDDNSYIYIGKMLFDKDKKYSEIIEDVKDWLSKEN